MPDGVETTRPGRADDAWAGGGDAATVAPPRYELGEQLGIGGMAVVWAARDRALDRAVALKLLHDRFLGADHQERLAAEARAMARLSHPNVVVVYDVGEAGGRTFVAMEQVRGGSLADWVKAPRPWREVVAVFRAAGAGLAAAHAAGIVHRDVKPSNILVGDDGRPRVADFGVAIDGPPGELADADLATTVMTAGLNGTPAYMAPERLRGRRADAASDQFSFAASLYEVLHGRRPFAGATIEELAAAASRPPPPVRAVPRWLHAVVERGLAADPARRFPSIAALVDALDGGRRRRRLIAAVAAGALVVAGGGAALAAIGGGGGGERGCPPAAARLRGVWDEDARARVTAAFAGPAPSYAAATGRVIVGQLDRHADRWALAYRAACTAPASPSAGARAAIVRRDALACLERRRDGLRRLVEALATIDRAAIGEAAGAVGGLARTGDCDDPALAAIGAGAPPAVHAALADARAALATGDPARAGARATEAVAGAGAADDRLLAAEALLVGARAALAVDDGAGAVTRLTEATTRAGADAPRALRLELHVELARALPHVGRRTDGLRALAAVDAEEPAVGDPARRLDALVVRADYFERNRQWDRALAADERALALVAEVHGADAPAGSELQAARARALRELERIDDAITAARRGVALAAQLGDEHPDVGRRRRELATTLAAAGDEKAAHLELTRALAILRAARGDAHEEVASMENALALSFLRLGEPASAVVQLEAAVASDAQRPAGKATASRRVNLGIALLAAGRAADAVPVLTDALAQTIGFLHPHHLDAVLVRRTLARALAAVGRTEEALAQLTEARTALATGRFADAEELARARRDEAEVLRLAGRPRDALAADQAAWTIVSARLPTGHRERGETQRALAEDRLALRQPAAAVALAEAAIGELATAPPAARAEARWVLARALWAAGQRERAGAIAAVAREDVAVPTAQAIDAWLAARPPSAARRGD